MGLSPIWTPEMDEKIRRAYRGGKYGACKAVAAKLGLSTSYVSFRAAVLGCERLKAPSNRYPAWPPEQDRVLEKHGHEPVTALMRRLKKVGPPRSEHQIYRRAAILSARGDIERLGVLRDGHYSLDDIALGMGFSRDVPHRWVQSGVLRAKKAGGQWAVKVRDLRMFLIKNVILYELGRCDKYWFVDVLSGNSWERANYRDSVGSGDAESGRLFAD